MNKWIRQFHRWLSIIFTLTVLANLVALAMQKQSTWIGLMALFPLILLMITGLYLFALPYQGKRESRANAGANPG